MRKFLQSVLVIFIAVWITGCSPDELDRIISEAKQNSGNIESVQSEISETASAATPETTAKSAEDIYREYLSQTLIPVLGLTDLSKFSTVTTIDNNSNISATKK